MGVATHSKNGSLAERLKRMGLQDAKAAPPKPEGKITARIEKADLRILKVKIIGTAPYLQCRFPEKAMAKMMATQLAGDRDKKNIKREPRNIKRDYEQSQHRMENGDCGIPASAFRAAAISACRLVGFKMTIAKLSIFIEGDGYDRLDGMPLVKIDGKPEMHQMIGRNADGSADIRIRSIWRKWSATLRIRYDANQFNANDVLNLLDRVGQQVGIGEGRADSRKSAGMMLGFFRIATGKAEMKSA